VERRAAHATVVDLAGGGGGGVLQLHRLGEGIGGGAPSAVVGEAVDATGIAGATVVEESESPVHVGHDEGVRVHVVVEDQFGHSRAVVLHEAGVAFVAAGATAVPMPRELAEASEMVLVVLPDLPADLEPVAAWETEVTAFRQTWRDHADSLVAWLTADWRELFGSSTRTYKPHQVEGYRAAIDAWCGTDTPPIGGRG
jgi:hypothetical protein